MGLNNYIGINANDPWEVRQAEYGTPDAPDCRTPEQREADRERVRLHDEQIHQGFVSHKAWEAEIIARWNAIGQYIRLGKAVVPLLIGDPRILGHEVRFVLTQTRWGTRDIAPYYLIDQRKSFAFGVEADSEKKWAEEVCHGKWAGASADYHGIALYRFVDDPDAEPWCMNKDFEKRVKAREGK